MYYLNDQHKPYEYAVYCLVKGSMPYISTIFSDIAQVEIFIENISKKHSRYHHLFYIDNGKYENEYPKELAKYYYKVLKRPINDWQEVA